MQKILISLPDQLAARLRTVVPARNRSKMLVVLIEQLVSQREKQLYDAAIAVEKDAALRDEMADWDISLQDGLDDESR